MKPFLLGIIVVLAGHILFGRLATTGETSTAVDPPRPTQSASNRFLRTLAQDPSAWLDLAALPTPRQEVAVAALGGQIFVIGGFTGDSGTANTVEAYDPATDRWQVRAPLPEALNHSLAATVGDTLYVIGGHPASGAEAVRTVYAYDAAANAWAVRAPMPTARGSHALAVVDGKIYAVGGAPAGREQDFAVYDPATDAWATLPPLPTPRNHLAAGGLNGKVYIIGGRSGDIGGITNVLEEYDPATRTWAQRRAMPTARGGIAAVAANGRLYVFGGEGNRNHPQGIFDQVEAYDPTTDTWQSLPPMAVPRHGISAAVLGDRIYIPGGATVEGFGVVATNQAMKLE